MSTSTSVIGFELSVNQKEIWSLGGVHRYYNDLSIVVNGVLNSTKLRACVERILRRHEILSYRCMSNGGSFFPSQAFDHRMGFDFKEEDLRRQSIDTCKKTGFEFLSRRYNAEEDNGLRIYLGRTEEDKYILIVRIYSLWSDHYSCEIFFKELCLEYFHYEENITITEDIPYRNFSQWQNDLFVTPDEDGLQFWKGYELDFEGTTHSVWKV